MSNVQLYKKYYKELLEIKSNGISYFGQVFFKDLYTKAEYEMLSRKVSYYESEIKKEGYVII